MTESNGRYAGPINHTPRRWITSDLHLSHGNIIKYCDRDFCLNSFEREEIAKTKKDFPGAQAALKQIIISKESIDLMDRTIIANINNLVGKDDILYMLGDFCWAKEFYQVVNFRNRINCKNIIGILGNHDFFSYREYSSIFNEVVNYKEIKYNGLNIVMCHYPIFSFNSMHRSGIMAHGHAHGNTENWKKEHLPGIPIIDIGVDCWNYEPVSFEEIIKKAEEIKNSVNKINYPDIN